MLNSFIRFDQQIILTTDQFEILNVIAKAHDKSISEYIQKAVMETLKTDIEFDNFCDMLLDKLDIKRKLTKLHKIKE